MRFYCIIIGMLLLCCFQQSEGVPTPQPNHTDIEDNVPNTLERKCNKITQVTISQELPKMSKLLSKTNQLTSANNTTMVSNFQVNLLCRFFDNYYSYRACAVCGRFEVQIQGRPNLTQL